MVDDLPIVELGTSAALSLKLCEQKFVFSDVRNLEPISPPIPQKLGSWMHVLIAAHYLSRLDSKRMAHWTQIHVEMTNQWRGERETLKALGGEVPDDGGDDLPQRALHLMDAYVYHYGTLAASRGWEDFEVVSIEAPYTFDIRVADRLIVRSRATTDAVIRDRRGHLWILETKTGQQFPYDRMLRLLEPQVTLQIQAVEQATGEPVDGAIYNWIRTIPPSRKTLINKDGTLSKRPGHTDYMTFLQVLNERGLMPGVEPYATKLRELADPTTSKFFRRVVVHRTKRAGYKAMDSHARLGIRAERLRRKPHTAIPVAFPMICRLCAYRPLCEAELGGDRVDIANARDRYRQRTDERTLLRLEMELAEDG